MVCSKFLLPGCAYSSLHPWRPSTLRTEGSQSEKYRRLIRICFRKWLVDICMYLVQIVLKQICLKLYTYYIIQSCWNALITRIALSTSANYGSSKINYYLTYRLINCWFSIAIIRELSQLPFTPACIHHILLWLLAFGVSFHMSVVGYFRQLKRCAIALVSVLHIYAVPNPSPESETGSLKGHKSPLVCAINFKLGTFVVLKVLKVLASSQCNALTRSLVSGTFGW